MNDERTSGNDRSELPPVTGSVNPCDIPCEKCGSVDILRQFFFEGQDTNGIVPNPKRSSEYVDRNDRYYQPALKDCITHHCRTCHYEWDGPPKTPNRQICESHENS